MGRKFKVEATVYVDECSGERSFHKIGFVVDVLFLFFTSSVGIICSLSDAIC